MTKLFTKLTVILLCLMLLAGCAQQAPAATAEPTQAPATQEPTAEPTQEPSQEQCGSSR